jgi:hypothetical protein
MERHDHGDKKGSFSGTAIRFGGAAWRRKSLLVMLLFAKSRIVQEKLFAVCEQMAARAALLGRLFLAV